MKYTRVKQLGLLAFLFLFLFFLLLIPYWVTFPAGALGLVASFLTTSHLLSDILIMMKIKSSPGDTIHESSWIYRVSLVAYSGYIRQQQERRGCLRAWTPTQQVQGLCEFQSSIIAWLPRPLATASPPHHYSGRGVPLPRPALVSAFLGGVHSNLEAE